MPIKLDDVDVAILESLLEDGRKSFRQISRETKVSTPTVKSRYQRLVNVGLIKSVTPLLDLKKVQNLSTIKFNLTRNRINKRTKKLAKGMIVKISCDFCKGPIEGKPRIFKFANFERFFCCTSCKSLYKEKYKNRIESLLSKSSK